MALREYLQDVLGITEQELLHPGHADSRVPTLPHSASPNF